MRFTPIFFILVLLSFSQCNTNTEHLTNNDIWPEIRKESKPWTRWWWMGNAVNKEDIEKQLRSLAGVGFGGVEITPIYGVKGYEDRYIDYLSDEWMEMLQFTIQKADELGMGVDMNLGTGWPFGGPQITPEMAASKLILQKYDLKAGERLVDPITIEDKKQNKDDVVLLEIMAYGKDGNTTDLKTYVDQDGILDWTPKSDGAVIAAFNAKTRQMVKRAAPGGKGWTMDHFSKEALEIYLSRFDSAFEKINSRPRSFFNDSFEVYGSSGTKDIFQEFQQRRGYDLKLQLRELGSKLDTEMNRRVQSDYRETVGELLMEEFTQPWTNWSHAHNAMSKNQAHGSPGNLLDLYGTVDIPECETFGSTYFPIPGLRRDTADIRIDNEVPDPIMLKFASSAANITGKKYVSSETFTWLAEHFRVSLSQCKPELEQALLSGVNHVFYHGTTYSPDEASWPGWLFYASVQFGLVNSFWPHINGLNNYIARCQSVLQQGNADNELLMYFPMYDIWNSTGQLDKQLKIHDIDEWLHPTSFYQESKNLMENGYFVDFASDKFISDFNVTDGEINHVNRGGKYKTLIIPTCEMMPIATLKNILKLAKNGAKIIFQELPKDVPGYHDLASRRDQMKELLGSIPFKNADQNMRTASIGDGEIVLFFDLNTALTNSKIYPETIQKTGLKFIKRKIDEDTYYYLVNHTERNIDEVIALNVDANNAILMNPNYGNFGKVSNVNEDGKAKVWVQLSSGESIIIRCTNKNVSEIHAWKYVTSSHKPIILDGSWKLTFLQGGPELPENTQLEKLISWTDLNDEKAVNFSGQSIYEYQLNLDGDLADDYLLELGEVAESAKVWINDQEVGVLWSLPFEVRIGKFVKKGSNSIKVEVANLMANRIRYMDQRGIEWRKFHEINFVNIDYKPFDASGWKPMASGLLGPVVLTEIDLE